MSRMEQTRPVSMVSLTVKSLVCLVVCSFNLVALAADETPVKETKPSWASPLPAPKVVAAPAQKKQQAKPQALPNPLPIKAKKTVNAAPANLLEKPLPLTRTKQVQLLKPAKPHLHKDKFIQPVDGTELEKGPGLEFATPQIAPVNPQNSQPFPSDPAPRTTPPEKSLFSDPPVEPKPAPSLDIPAKAPLQTSPAPQLSQPAPFAPSAIPQEPVLSQPAPAQPTPAFQQQNNFPPPQQQTTYNPPTSEPQLLTPSPRQVSAQKTVQEDVHEVQPGENYWTISRQHFGTARYFAALAEYNRHRIPRPDRMKPGMFVLVPDTKTLEQRYPKIAGIVDMKPSPESLLPSGFFIGPGGQPMYRIGKGDTLTDIAEKHLGRTARWTQVVGMNRDLLKDGNTLKIGMVLRLPHDASQVALAPAGSVLR